MIKRYLANVLEKIFAMLALFDVFLTVAGAHADDASLKTLDPNPGAGTLTELTLEEWLNAALENSHRKPASRFAVVMAEAQHRQALMRGMFLVMTCRRKED